MRRIAAVLLVLVPVVSLPVMAQQAGPRYVNEALYQISFADMDEWNQIYRDYAVPILEQLRNEGLIQGWSASTHQTGGKYNFRFALRFHDWDSIDGAYEAYFARFSEAAPPGIVEKVRGMIMSHQDEIWLIRDPHVSQTAPPTRYIYDSTFQLSFADMEEWNRLYEEALVPVLTELVNEGLLNGWVMLNHQFGGPHNWKILYFCKDWDSMDDFFGNYFGRLEERYPTALDKFAELIVSHRDNVWEPVPTEESADDM